MEVLIAQREGLEDSMSSIDGAVQWVRSCTCMQNLNQADQTRSHGIVEFYCQHSFVLHAAQRLGDRDVH